MREGMMTGSACHLISLHVAETPNRQFDVDDDGLVERHGRAGDARPEEGGVDHGRLHLCCRGTLNLSAADVASVLYGSACLAVVE
jgi:hypothetical protein